MNTNQVRELVARLRAFPENVLEGSSLCVEAADAIEALLSPPVEGWKLVPIEPTFEMCRAGGFSWELPPFPWRYKAMLAVAPAPNNQEDKPIPKSDKGNLAVHLGEVSPDRSAG